MSDLPESPPAPPSIEPLSHAFLAGCVAALYGEDGAPSIGWTYVSPPGTTCYFGILRLERWLIIVARGSKTFGDWLRDVQARAETPVSHAQMGHVHSGFYDGTDDAWDIIEPYLQAGDMVVFCGHSLGGTHASILAAHMLLSAKAQTLGLMPHFILTWGSPKPGFQDFADLLKNIPMVGYRNERANRHDGVTYLPIAIWPLLYVHVVSPTVVSSGPPPSSILSDLGPDLALHHFTLYLPATPPDAVIPPV
jgi:hypothetical protein